MINRLDASSHQHKYNTTANDQEHLWKAINIYDLLPKSKAYWCVHTHT